MKQFSMKRFTASLLIFAMLVAILPASLFSFVISADGSNEPVYVLAGSDFQADNHTASAANVSSILNQIKNVYGTMDGFLFAGDYDVNYSDSAGGKAKLQETVQGVYGKGMDEVYVQGNHDGDDLVGSTLSASGENDAEDYGVFVINEKDYMWYNDDETTIKNTAANLESYLNGKLEDKYSKPIFVVSHLPLHYSMRTRSGGGDGKYANYIFDVLNKAGNAGLNIIFLAGHDHSHGWDDYLGGAAIFLKKGDKINIAQSSTTVFKEETLAFTYMNAGYVGYYGTSYTSDVDKTLTMTTFAITDTEVTITRFDSTGTHNLKSAGVYNVEYPDSKYYSTNIDVVKSSYTLKLNQFEPDKVVEDVASGVTVSAPGVTGVSVTVNNPTYDTEIYSAYVSYDITPTGYKQGDTATVTVEVDPEKFDASRQVLVIDKKMNTGVFKDIVDGTVTFTTKHFSEYDIAQYADGAGVTANGNLATDPSVANANSAPQAGHYYLIYNTGAQDTLTGASHVANNSTGLALVEGGAYNVHYNDKNEIDNVWYYDGTYFRYLRADGKYLSVGPTQDTAGLTADANSTSLAKISNNNDGTYTLGASSGDFRYLNNVGGWGTVAAAWSQGGNNNNGSKWNFREVTFGSGDPVTLMVNPASKTVTNGATANLTALVLVNGSSATSKNITWTSSDPTVATVDNNGVVTGLKDGDAKITATLTQANGQNVNGTVKVEIPVTVKTRKATSIDVSPMEGTVQRNAKDTTTTGSTMTVTYNNGDIEYNVPVTLSMLTNADGKAVSTGTIGTLENLTVTYEGATVSGYTLNVVAKAGNNHPNYPDEGAVKITKHATGVDFQASGVAQVELSVSGVPVKKGADVIVMLDLSSSMKDNSITVNGVTKSRVQVLRDSMQSLLEQLQKNGEDGEPMDIRIAVADFHRYYLTDDSSYYINENDHVAGGSIRGNKDGTNKVYTGNEQIGAGAFVDVHTLATNAFDGLTTQSGTNYDYAFDVTYQLGEAITAANAANGEDRDLYVIFMSDGAPYQYNYFSAGSGDDYWNNWLQGTMTDVMFAGGSNKNYYNEDGKHWMAEAIKGDPAESYKVIRKGTGGIENLTATNTENIYTVPGLGAKMYSIGFCLKDDSDIKLASMDAVIQNIASSKEYYFRANTADDLTSAFSAIGTDIAYAANNARFVDQMGDQYSIKLNTSTYDIVNDNGTPDNPDDDTVVETKTVTPTIEVLTYDIYTRSDYDNKLCALAQIGDRKTNADGSYIYTVLERVTFNEAGNEAYSNLIGDGKQNILIDGIICANTFWYNTTANAVEIEGVDIPGKSNGGVTSSSSSNVLPAETFYWKVGTVQTKELAIRYYVYLDGSMEGNREAGSYNTNNYATLYYDNYLGNSCYLDAPVPVLAWEAARVSYGFYLVNSQGEPVNINGEKVSFSERVIIVDRTPYDEVLLNSGDTVNSMNIIAGDKKVLPDGYNLYDEDAKYTVTVNSNGTGSWVIEKGEDKVATTYVTDFSGTVQYSNALEVEAVGYDYTHTVVWFALQWEPKPMPDTIVIDYGLPVDIHVMTNDMFGKYGTLVGVAVGDLTETASRNENSITATTADGQFGSAKITSVESGVIRYTLNPGSDLKMTGADVFTYSVVYHNEDYSQNNGYYYQTVTVIPATTIYYEDSFLTLESYKVSGTESTKDETSAWTQAGNTVAGATQGEDRPGSVNYGFGTVIDANNVYGYDGAYTNMSTYSMGSAASVHVGANSYATATFTFYGTGFDVISMTSDDTGVLVVQVYDENDNRVRNTIVNTYYGMDEDGTISPNDPDALYQVPVIKIEHLEYGQYSVTITASYNSYMDKTEDAGYDLYLDAIRIYDPTGNRDDTSNEAYIADGEGWPTYEELRNNVIKASDYKVTTSTDEEGNVTVTITDDDIEDGDDKVGGAIFIDCNDATTSIADYVSYGPNNELYLAAGQAIAFNVTTNDYVADVQLGIKVGNGGSVTYSINGDQKTVTSATDMYYSILSYAKAGTVVIKNVSGGILSLTNIKVTYTQAPTTGEDPTDPAATTSLLWMDGESAGRALMMLRAPVVEEQNPEVTEPEVTEPEVTEPEVTEPEVTEPEVTEPEVTEPEETAPEKNDPKKEAVEKAVETISKVVKKLLGWLFG